MPNTASPLTNVPHREGPCASVSLGDSPPPELGRGVRAIAQWGGHLPCTRLTQGRSPAFPMVPRAPQEKVLIAEPGGALSITVTRTAEMKQNQNRARVKVRVLTRISPARPGASRCPGRPWQVWGAQGLCGQCSVSGHLHSWVQVEADWTSAFPHHAVAPTCAPDAITGSLC